VNTWVFLVIDLCSAAVLAVGTPRMVIAVVDRSRGRAVPWGLATRVGFAVPDGSVLRAPGRMPVMLIVMLTAIVTVSVLATVIGLIRQVRAGRRARSTAAHEVAA
jgi:hypothetical protein